MRFRICSMAVLLTCVCSAAAVACNIPVFRYALERWRPDNIELIIFAEDGKFGEHASFVDSLKQSSLENDGSFNTSVSIIDPKSGDEKKLWNQLSSETAPTLPYFVSRTEVKGNQVNNWTGEVAKVNSANLLRSPARQELRKRLLKGDSIVWLLLKSTDEAKNKAAKELLEAECEKLAESLELPEGIGEPGSELFSDVPLLLRFTVLEVDSSDPKEVYLNELLSGFHPEAFAGGQPIIAPVFGRGRSLEVLPGNEINGQLISELTSFLCGACSCKVKGLNPGFDLLMEANWDDELFGPDGERPSDASEKATPLPTLITIPPGRSGRQ